MDLNKLGQMLGSGNKDFLIEDAIFLTEKAKDFLRTVNQTAIKAKDIKEG